MIHDDACELSKPCTTCQGWVSVAMAHCHCGSRAFPLCTGCRDGKHLHHTPTNPGTGKACACDLCCIAA